MQPEKLSKNSNEKSNNEMMQIWVTKSRWRRPIPLMWGVLALMLFVTFAVITQIQFSRIADDKIYAVEIDAYNSDVRAYDVAVRLNEDCVKGIGTRDTYRSLFGGVSRLFQISADLPANLFPDSTIAKAYQDTLTAGINELLTQPVEQDLPVKKASECPAIPANEPVKPTR